MSGETAQSSAFKVEHPDFERSPFTGMGRRHWLDAFRFVLDGAFSHIEDPDAPLLFPPEAGVGAYSVERDKLKMRAEAFEGLSRPFFYGAALINEDPQIQLRGTPVRDYYARQILLGTDPSHPNYWGHPDWMKPHTECLIPGQATVESAALVLSLWQCRAHVWDRYDEAQQRQIAGFLSDWGHTRTGHNNWHFFNVLILSFLKDQGFAVDEDTLIDHLRHLLSWYVGDGWYRDGVNFSNYSHWAFQYYGAVWSHWYGQRVYPEIASIFRQRHAEMMSTLPRFFGPGGESPLWTRSAPYRYAASAALTTGHLWSQPTDDNPGWSRRIASGNMLQFLTRPEVFKNRIPQLGFYGRFPPAVEPYLSSASVFWCAKNTSAFLLPEDSPFWTAEENEGLWADRPVASSITLPGPGLTVANDSRAGTTEIRPGKVPACGPGDLRLGFNTHFPWECAGGDEDLPSQTYALRQHGTGRVFQQALRMHFIGERGGVLYRLLEFEGLRAVIDLAEIPVPCGVVRIDRVRVNFPYDLRLTHFGLPVAVPDSAETQSRRIDGFSCTELRSAHGQLSLARLDGWDDLRIDRRTGCNAVTADSLLPLACASRPKLHGGFQLCISVLLANASEDGLSDEEIQPVAERRILPLSPSGSPLGCEITLRNGDRYEIDFDRNEGALGS